jgi:arylsulfatase A-like enzyme
MAATRNCHLRPLPRINGAPLRVAGLAIWPGVIRPASRSDALVGSIDVFPTLAQIAGAQLPSGTEGE